VAAIRRCIFAVVVVGRLVGKWLLPTNSSTIIAISGGSGLRQKDLLIAREKSAVRLRCVFAVRFLEAWEVSA
jgi:hypothetical protein